MQQCVRCGSMAEQGNPLILVLTGTIGPDWICLADLMAEAKLREYVLSS